MVKGPPINIPMVAVKNMINAFGPSFKIPFKSMLSVRKIREASNKNLEDTWYRLLDPVNCL